MEEFVHEIDEDDLEDYRLLIRQRREIEMQLIQLQQYMEEKYLAGAEDESEFYIDWPAGAIYLWQS